MFLEDLKLMVKNCEQYNGVNHYYSKEASQIYHETLELINVDRDILGHDKDPYTIQQNDIRSKYFFFFLFLIFNYFVIDFIN